MKKFICGLLVGIILTFTFTAFAYSAIKEAYFNTEIKVSYNGRPVDIEKVTVIKDSEVNGRTYGSINDIAIALGKSVSWDNATKTINITDTEVDNMSTVIETTTTTVDTSEWVDIRSFCKENNVSFEASSTLITLTKGDIKIEIPMSKYPRTPDGEYTDGDYGDIETPYGSLRAKVINGTSCFNLSDLIAAGLAD